MIIDLKKKYVAILITTKGEMKIELFPQEAPNTVNNFVFLAREGFYNDTIFHRIIKDFMIQGGDPTGTGRGGPGYTFADEPIKRSYTRGIIAMANAGPNTNGSQFFIMHKDYDLQKNYVIFGKIRENDAESLATLDAIAQTAVTMSESGEQSKPIENVILTRVDIQEQ
ncbi:MAG: peptidylprolyl isomerase [Patescibacteria group bacterium]|nr:peptidylprolyl isomerase [Patescibacteria group bacterium]